MRKYFFASSTFSGNKFLSISREATKDKDGYKEVLGMWLGKNESAAYWMTVLTDMKARGMEDILITATDNLNGFTQTIRTVFPQSATQICVVHQIRNRCRYVVWKDKREFTIDMRDI